MSVLTVLIVDDEQLVRDNINYALKKTGILCVVAGAARNGEEAYDLYRRLLPDVIITDVRMPRMNGLELISKIRKTDNKTSFIIISGYADFSYAQQAMREGVHHYVLKPVKISDLNQALSDIARTLKKETGIGLSEGDRLLNYIENHFYENLNLQYLAERFNFNQKYISNMIKTKTDMSFTDLLIQLRMQKAIDLLKHSSLEVKTVAAQVGYDDQQYFHRVFKRKMGCTPIQYRTLHQEKSKGRLKQ